MKTRLFLLAAAFSSGIAMLGAQDAPKPPQGGPGGPGAPGGGDPQARFDEAYKKMDANSDGKVTKEEFLEFSKKEAEERFSKLDASGTGSVSKDQLSEAMRRMRGGDGGQRRPEGFRKPEGDTGGTRPRPGADNSAPGGNPPPPPAEGSTAGQGGPGGPGGQGMRGGAGASGMGELFRKIQENGSVTMAEFTKMSEEQFKRMDTNGDGKITKEELEELAKKMRATFGGGQGAPGAPGAQGGAPQGGGEGGFRRRPSGDGAGTPPKGGVPKRPEAN